MRVHDWPKWLTSTWALLILIVVLLTVSGLELNQWRKRKQIQREIDQITQQQRDLEQKNHDLAVSLDLLNTKDYKEKIAREQLNLKKEGEIVVNFSQAQERDSQSPTGATETNAQRWWRYFFRH